MDESGDLGFGVGSKYLILAFISPESGKTLNKMMKNINAHLIRNGWNPDLEIKASNVWYSPSQDEQPPSYKYKNLREIPMEYILRSIADLDGYIEYTAIKLDTVSDGLKTAPSGILYNYFAWQLLKGPLCHFPVVSLYVDRRNREYHSLLKFDGYIEGQAGIARAERKRDPITLKICHYHSRSADDCKPEERGQVHFGVRGLQAVDFVCWAIKRKFENNENRWYSMIEKQIRWKQHLYFDNPDAAKTKSS
jgi:hypothetical protein